MKQWIIKSGFFLVLFLTMVSCSVDRDDEASVFGTWIETSPVPGRTTLVFDTNSRLTRIDGEGNAEIYNYRIDSKTLYLSPASGAEGSSELFFEQINVNKIKVENLYGSIPEAERIFIILERYR